MAQTQMSDEAQYLVAFAMTIWGLVLIALNRRIGAATGAIFGKLGAFWYRQTKSGSYPIVWVGGAIFVAAGITTMVVNIAKS